jgi:hypothetical protein
MAGKKGKSGRPRKPGKVYEFDFYYRLIPGEDPPELEAILEAIVNARGRKRRDIIRDTLIGGAQKARTTAEKSEDSETEELINSLFDNF